MSVSAGKLLCAAIGTLLVHQPANALSSSFKGELKFQSQYLDTPGDSLSASLGVKSHVDNDLKVRLMSEGLLASNWSWDSALVLSARYGEGVVLERKLYTYDPAFYTPFEDRQWWDLQHTFSDSGKHYQDMRFDRLSLSYSSNHAVAKVGRQVLTWGGGLVFHPMDLYNPFPPNAVDTEYKPGSDMLYGQWLYDSGSDIQGVIAPRRDPVSGNVQKEQSAAGVKWHGFTGRYGYELMAARNYQSDILGLGVNSSLGGATWTAEVVPRRLQDGALRSSWLLNLQYAWSFRGKNINGYTEYFYNGFGAKTSGTALNEFPQELTERFARGELFTLARNYLALGVTLEWNPLLNIQPLLISNLDDGSTLLLAQLERNLKDNLNLTFAVQTGIGPKGSEYGGLEITANADIYVAPNRYLYARVDWYF